MRSALVALTTLAALVLSGCAGGAEDDRPAGEIVIQHAWGKDTYPKNPERVVAIGTAVDNLLELGITPTAIVVRPDDADAVWKNDRLEGVQRIEAADTTTVPLEEIAAVEPDLIVGDFYRVSEETYNQLKPVAPVLGAIGTEGDDSGWRPQLQALGYIYGKEDLAKQIIADDRQRFVDVRAELPGLEGKTALVAQYRGGQFYAIADPANPSNDFFSELGMTLPEVLVNGDVNVAFDRAAVSPENVEKLSADLMVLYAADGMDAVRSVPGYGDLPQVQRGTAVESNNPLSAALNIPSSLNRAWALEEIHEYLVRVAEQPAVETPGTEAGN